MGSGGAPQSDYWITPRIYNHLFNQLNLSSSYKLDTSQQPTRVIQAMGLIGKDDSITLEPWYYFTTTLGIPVTGTYTIEAVDALSQTLASQGFAVSFVAMSNPPEDIDPAPFDVAVGFPPDTKAFRIKHGETVLRVVPVSNHVPSVRVISPNGGETWGVTGFYPISWAGSDNDGDALTYTVLYSPGGNNWITVAANITTTQVTVNTAGLPGSSTASVEVIVTDGINTSSDVSDATFTVGRKGPQAFILSPMTGSMHPTMEQFYLEGYAYDLEDGSLGETTLQWSSDRDGYLGSGSLLLVNLSYGQHVITLTAKDSDDNTSTATITVFVGYKIYLPLTVK
jgi:hypothetical protein